MDKQAQVKQLWHLAYDLIRGPGRLKSISDAAALPDSFDEHFLNDIAELASLEGDEIVAAIADVRAKAAICQATGLIGRTDLERINEALDKIGG